jgi:hypothetical protein
MLDAELNEKPASTCCSDSCCGESQVTSNWAEYDLNEFAASVKVLALK